MAAHFYNETNGRSSKLTRLQFNETINEYIYLHNCKHTHTAQIQIHYRHASKLENSDYCNS